MPLSRRDFVKGTALAALLTNHFPLSVSAMAEPPTASPVAQSLPDEDGYDLWLRYHPVENATLAAHYRASTAALVLTTSDTISPSIKSELTHACSAMLGHTLTDAQSVTADGSVLIGTPKTVPDLHTIVPKFDFSTLGDEGFIVKNTTVKGHKTLVIGANHERGLLYGTFALIKQLQLRQPLDHLDLVDIPKAHLRLVNHWDNLDRTVTRGYAGPSIFHFDDLTRPNPRYTDYARILASVGINATVINNVNAPPGILDSNMIPGYVALAAIFRQWGIRLFLSVNFGSPIALTADDDQPLHTADPLDKQVQAWWVDKVAEIYKAIPDFGGFLVKADSEGEPGPLTYNRTHAEGANMFAKALTHHGGIVIWRSFVHKGFEGWSEYEYQSFHPLDGKFDQNVVVQTKNGPIDFLPQEPTNPLFGAMPKTNQMIELEITQEYTGHATHLCYLPVYWNQVLTFDTRYDKTGPTVADIIDGTADKQSLTGFAGVINFGDDLNWTGSYLAAANTHGFARLAWDHTLDVQAIATEWTQLTFGLDPVVSSTIVPMLLSSWETYVDYTSLNGTGYVVDPMGAHYEPDPQGTQNLTHYTNHDGSGYDRTYATGSGYTRLYSDYWFQQYENIDTCPDDLLMFMHIVPWEFKLSTGETMIQQIYDNQFTAADEVVALVEAWASLKNRIDNKRFTAVLEQLNQQVFQSLVWRDVLAAYCFDNARIVSTTKPWLQLEMDGNTTLLFGGSENNLTFDLTNATNNTQSLTVAIGQEHASWTTDQISVDLDSRQSKTGSLRVKPSIEPYLGPVRFSCKPSNVAQIGFDTQIVITTPDPASCTLAFDVGATSNTAIAGYVPLSDGDIWTDTSEYGWVGKAPQNAKPDRAWNSLQDDFVTANSPRTLRLRIPDGKQRGWMLIGGHAQGTLPIRVTLDNRPLIETGYLSEDIFEWFSFTLDGGKKDRLVDLTFSGADSRIWRLAALVLLKPGL